MAKKESTKFNNPGRYDFMSKAGMFSVVSTVLVVIALGLIFGRGFQYGIDFAGGTEFQVKFSEEPSVETVRGKLGELGFAGAVVQTIGSAKELLIRLESATGESEKEINQKNQDTIRKVQSSLKTSFKVEDGGVSVGSVGPQIGDELKTNGILAILYSLIMILIYVALRFDFKYAPGAVLCLFHDAMITLGIFVILQKEVNLQILAAILTIIGYSLNDTIVNFDRIRENEGVFKGKGMKFIINRSLNDVLSRTLLTSITTLVAVLALYILADGVIQEIAFTLAIGVVVGTYSSIYVASPLVMVTEKLLKQNS